MSKSKSISKFDMLKIIALQNTNILAILQVRNINKFSTDTTITKLYEEAQYTTLRDEITNKK